MTDLILKFDHTDPAGNAVYGVIEELYSIYGVTGEKSVGQVRIPPDPRIAELEAENARVLMMARAFEDDIERVKSARRFTIDPLHSTPRPAASGEFMVADDVLKALEGDDDRHIEKVVELEAFKQAVAELLPETNQLDGSPTMCSASAAKKIRALLEKGVSSE